jgi:hypothetical protein
MPCAAKTARVLLFVSRNRPYEDKTGYKVQHIRRFFQCERKTEPGKLAANAAIGKKSNA